MVSLGVKANLYKAVFPATSCLSLHCSLDVVYTKHSLLDFVVLYQIKWYQEGLDGIFSLDRKMELVRGKVDGAFLGPFEGLWYVLHVLEHKLCIVIGY